MINHRFQRKGSSGAGEGVAAVILLTEHRFQPKETGAAAAGGEVVDDEQDAAGVIVSLQLM